MSLIKSLRDTRLDLKKHRLAQASAERLIGSVISEQLSQIRGSKQVFLQFLGVAQHSYMTAKSLLKENMLVVVPSEVSKIVLPVVHLARLKSAKKTTIICESSNEEILDLKERLHIKFKEELFEIVSPAKGLRQIPSEQEYYGHTYVIWTTVDSSLISSILSTKKFQALDLLALDYSFGVNQEIENMLIGEGILMVETINGYGYASIRQ